VTATFAFYCKRTTFKCAVARQGWPVLQSCLSSTMVKQLHVQSSVFPACRSVETNNLSGTLPSEWSAMTKMEIL
jgi:hypothetical protein